MTQILQILQILHLDVQVFQTIMCFSKGFARSHSILHDFSLSHILNPPI